MKKERRRIMLICPNNYGHIPRQKERKRKNKRDEKKETGRRDKLSEGTNSTT